MFFVEDLFKNDNIATITDTISGKSYNIDCRELVRFCKSGNTVFGVVYYTHVIDESQDWIVIHGDNYDSYVITKVDSKYLRGTNILSKDNNKRYKEVKLYANKAKLLGMERSIYVIALDDDKKVVYDVGFTLNEVDDTSLSWHLSSQYKYDNRGSFTLYDRNYNIEVFDIKDLPHFKIPSIVTFIDFYRVKVNYPCILDVPDTDIFLFNIGKISYNIILQVPENLRELYEDCDCCKIYY